MDNILIKTLDWGMVTLHKATLYVWGGKIRISAYPLNAINVLKQTYSFKLKHILIPTWDIVERFYAKFCKPTNESYVAICQNGISSIHICFTCEGNENSQTRLRCQCWIRLSIIVSLLHKYSIHWNGVAASIPTNLYAARETISNGRPLLPSHNE